MKRHIKREVITSVTIVEEKQSDWTTFIPHREKTFWRSEVKEGWYNGHPHWGDKRTPKQVVESDQYFIKDNEVWYNPCIKLFIGSNCTDVIYFSSMEKLEAFRKKWFSHCNFSLK